MYACCHKCDPVHSAWAVFNGIKKNEALDAAEFSIMSPRDKQIAVASRAADIFENSSCQVNTCDRCQLVIALQRRARYNADPAAVKNAILHYAFFYPISHVVVPVSTKNCKLGRKRSIEKLVLMALLYRMRQSGVHNPSSGVGTCHLFVSIRFCHKPSTALYGKPNCLQVLIASVQEFHHCSAVALNAILGRDEFDIDGGESVDKRQTQTKFDKLYFSEYLFKDGILLT